MLTLITGTNRGIGLELVRAAKKRGDDVIAVCRKSSPELDALGVRVESGIDMTDEDALARLGKKLHDTRLDRVVLNAGVLKSDALEAVTKDALMHQLEVNAVAPLLLTKALLPCFHAGTKLSIVTSRMGSIADNGSGGYYGYRMSKAAVNMAAMSLARDLRSKGVAVMVVHPGFIRTEMTGGQGSEEPNVAASRILARLEELTLETTGSFRHANGEMLPW